MGAPRSLKLVFTINVDKGAGLGALSRSLAVGAAERANAEKSAAGVSGWQVGSPWRGQ